MDETKLIEVAAYGSLVPYWAFSVATAASFYAGTRWIGAHFKPEFKTKLTQWLSGTYEDTWTAQFGRLFDTVFGEKHFSWKRLYRSAVVSVLSVVYLYVLFAHVLGVVGDRTFGTLAFWQTLLLGAAINIIPDYLSLIETRWLLQRFERVRSLPLQIGLLIIDLVFTAAIIFGAIYLYSLIFIDGRAPSWVELIALFSPFAVLFYSTFLTSVWAWLYCLTTWFIRLFTKVGLSRILDVKGEPVKQIALVAAALVLGGGLALGPVVNPEKGGFVSSFDEVICEWDFGACVHAARVSVKDPKTAVRAAHFMQQACRNDDESSCGVRLETYFGGDRKSINAIWESSCEAGLARGCSNFAYALDLGIEVDVDLPRAFSLYERACRSRDQRACTNLGVMYEHGRSVTVDVPRALKLYHRACVDGVMKGCNNAGIIYAIGKGVDVDLPLAIQFLNQACEGGDMTGCSSLGVMYESGFGTEIDLPRAFDLYDRACEGGKMKGCSDLGVMYANGNGVDADLNRAIELFDRSCHGGEMAGCSNLGFMYEYGLGVAIDLPRALSSYRKACAQGNQDGCDRLDSR